MRLKFQNYYNVQNSIRKERGCVCSNEQVDIRHNNSYNVTLECQQNGDLVSVCVSNWGEKRVNVSGRKGYVHVIKIGERKG